MNEKCKQTRAKTATKRKLQAEKWRKITQTLEQSNDERDEVDERKEQNYAHATQVQQRRHILQ